MKQQSYICTYGETTYGLSIVSEDHTDVLDLNTMLCVLHSYRRTLQSFATTLVNNKQMDQQFKPVQQDDNVCNLQ